MSAINDLRRWLQQAPKTPDLRVLAVALMLSVAVSSAVALFADRLQQGLAAQTGEAIGADWVVSSRQRFDPEWVAQLQALATAATRTVSLNSSVWAGDESVLAAVKAVEPGYPLRSALQIRQGTTIETVTPPRLPEPGTVWGDARLLAQLKVSVGDAIEIGARSFTVGAELVFEPDRSSGFSDLAPRVLMREDDLASTGLLLPGSRRTTRWQFTATPDGLAALKAIPLPAGVTGQDARSARPEIQQALERAERFLQLTALAALLLGMVAIGLATQQYAQRLMPEVALMRTLGARTRRLLGRQLMGVLAWTLLASSLGLVLGYAAHFVLGALGEALLQQTLPPPQLISLWPPLLLAWILVLGLTGPALWAAVRTPPVQIFQRPAQTHTPFARLALLGGVFTALGLLAWQLQSASLLLWTLLGAAGTALLLLVIARSVLWVMAQALRLPALPGRAAWQQLVRRPWSTAAQAMAFGLGIWLILLLTVVRTDLLAGWQNQLPDNTPNQFLIDIQPEQVQPLSEFLTASGLPPTRIWPMARARLVALNGRPVDAEQFEDPDTQRWIRRDFNLSWTDTLGPDNTLIEGPWWTPEEADQPWLSVSEYGRDRLNLKLGDTLTLQFADQTITLTVRNFRRVDWTSFQPNFFLLTPPRALPAVPTTNLTSLYVAPDQQGVMRDLRDTFPNLTAIDLTAIMDQVRRLVTQLTSALEFLFLFTLAAGLVVLWGAMESTRQARSQAIALMRTLGASRRQLRRQLLSEFAWLGILAGGVAAIAAQMTGWLVAQQVFSMSYTLNAALPLAGMLGGGLLTAGLAWLVLRDLIDTSPTRVLSR